MAVKIPTSFFATFFITFAHLFFSCSSQDTICPFEAIYQLGDSISDTGNLIRLDSIGANSYAAHLPYGETTFHKPTGRYSDGLLMIDYLSMALQLPFLNPYLDKNASFKHGVNFAVAGSTTLDSSFFLERNISSLSTPNSSLSSQLDWFKDHLSSTCSSLQDCAWKLRKALVMMGEIGGNDYNYAIFQGKPIDEVQTYVPQVVGVISNAIREVIGLGAKRIVIPGNFPIGCFPIYLSSFPSSDPKAYDDKGCLIGFNELASFHNDLLQGSLNLLQQEFPDVVILYADYYNAFQSILHNPYLGFDKKSLLKACCGSEGKYNFNVTKMCGSPGVNICPNPNQHISWDGIHLTQEGYHHMSEILILSILSRIQCVW